MTDKSKDGGPAFPLTVQLPTSWCEMPGLSLRDYFAAQAITSVAASDNWGTETEEDVAAAAYAIADAMLKARGMQ